MVTRHHPWVQRPIEINRDILFKCLYKQTLGWKHAEVPVFGFGDKEYPEGSCFVALVKNPYSWLVSLHRRPYQGRRHSFWRALPFDEFLRTPWPTVGREGSEVRVFANPIQMWVAKVGSYERLSSLGPTCRVRYEDLLANPENQIKKIAYSLDLASSSERFHDLSYSTKRDGKSSDYYRQYYLGERWLDAYNTEQIRFVNSHLDRKLMSTWDYCLL